MRPCLLIILLAMCFNIYLRVVSALNCILNMIFKDPWNFKYLSCKILTTVCSIHPIYEWRLVQILVIGAVICVIITILIFMKFYCTLCLSSFIINYRFMHFYYRFLWPKARKGCDWFDWKQDLKSFGIQLESSSWVKQLV